jgi:transcriptional regulator with XRE-family HTH domain
MVEARTATGLTQTELAARLQKPQSYVSKYERGERRIDIIEFRAIAVALGINPEELFRKIIHRI